MHLKTAEPLMLFVYQNPVKEKRLLRFTYSSNHQAPFLELPRFFLSQKGETFILEEISAFLNSKKTVKHVNLKVLSLFRQIFQLEYIISTSLSEFQKQIIDIMWLKKIKFCLPQRYLVEKLKSVINNQAKQANPIRRIEEICYAKES